MLSGLKYSRADITTASAMVSEYSFSDYSSPHLRALRRLDAITGLMTETPLSRSTRVGLLSFHDRLVNDLDDLWAAVRAGHLTVESLPVLKALRTVHCVDLWYLLSSPSPRVEDVLREVRLIRNILTKIVRPQARGLSRA